MLKMLESQLQLTYLFILFKLLIFNYLYPNWIQRHNIKPLNFK